MILSAPIIGGLFLSGRGLTVGDVGRERRNDAKPRSWVPPYGLPPRRRAQVPRGSVWSDRAAGSVGSQASSVSGTRRAAAMATASVNRGCCSPASYRRICRVSTPAAFARASWFVLDEPLIH
jgi:hypothetical protein